MQPIQLCILERRKPWWPPACKRRLRSSPTQWRTPGRSPGCERGWRKSMTQIKKARLDTCLQEKGEGQVQHTPEYHGGHLEEKDNIKSNSPKNANVFTSHFLSWFLNYSSQKQNIHPFTFTVSCKLKKLSKTLEFEVSLSLIWNNSNVFSQYLWFLITECSSYVPTSHSDFPINHCSHCLGGRQVDLGFASVYLNFDCAYLRGVSALLVKAHWKCPIQIWQPRLPFYPCPNISDIVAWDKLTILGITFSHHNTMKKSQLLKMKKGAELNYVLCCLNLI